jgi:phosphinothricin acetyltransferase
MPAVIVRPAEPRDLERLAAIYNEGIAERQATFETRPRTARDFRGRELLLVAESDGEVVGWAATAPYSDREAYAGVAEFAVYVAAGARRSGAGRALMEELARRAAAAGRHKLVSKVLTTNAGSRALLTRCGFREVGVHERHGLLDGTWRDVVVVEKLL